MIPKNITSDYASHTKEELFAELALRGVKDVPTNALKDDIVARLELEDEVDASDPREQDPKGLDNKAVATSDGQVTRSVPIDLDEYKGQYRLVKDSFPGEVFGLKIVEKEDVRHGKTHHAKSPLRFGDYTPEEFRAQFDKIS